MGPTAIAAAWAAVKGFVKQFIETYLRRWRDANAGAAKQRADDAAADEQQADQAGRNADEVADLSDAELRERARRWVRPD